MVYLTGGLLQPRTRAFPRDRGISLWFDQLEPEPVGFIEFDAYEPYLPEDHNESEHWEDWNETDPIFDHNYSDEYDPIDDFEDWNDSEFDHDDNFSDTIEDGHPVFEFNSLDLLELTGIDLPAGTYALIAFDEFFVDLEPAFADEEGTWFTSQEDYFNLVPERFLEIEELASWFDQLEPEPVGFVEFDVYEPYLPEDHNESEHWEDWNETDPIFDHNYSDEYDPIDDFEDWNDSEFDHDDNFSDTIEDGHPVFEFNSLDLLELTGVDLPAGTYALIAFDEFFVDLEPAFADEEGTWFTSQEDYFNLVPERFLEIEELASWFDRLEPEPVGFVEFDIYEPYLPEDHNESEHWDDWNETDPIFDHNYSDEYDPIDDFEDLNDSEFDFDDNFSDVPDDITEEDNFPLVIISEILDKDGILTVTAQLAEDVGYILDCGIRISSSVVMIDNEELLGDFDPINRNFQVILPDSIDRSENLYLEAFAFNSSGEGVSAVRKLQRIPLMDELVPDSQSLSDGWKLSSWFGVYRSFPSTQWLFHEKMGWIYLVNDENNGFWIWKEEHGWLWTQEQLWPFLYSNQTGNWLYLFSDGKGLPLFYNYESNDYFMIR